MNTWLSIALTPFDMKHIEYYLRYAIIPVFVAGMYYGLIADMTAGLYPAYNPDGIDYRFLEEVAVIFFAFSYFIINWSFYLMNFTGGYNGGRGELRLKDITLALVFCLLFDLYGFAIDPIMLWVSGFYDAGWVDIVYLLLEKLVGSILFLMVFWSIDLALHKRLGYLELLKIISANIMKLIGLSLALVLGMDVLGGIVFQGVSWFLNEIDYLDPFYTLRLILFAIWYSVIVGSWLSILSVFYKSWHKIPSEG